MLFLYFLLLFLLLLAVGLRITKNADDMNDDFRASEFSLQGEKGATGMPPTSDGTDNVRTVGCAIDQISRRIKD